MRRTGRRATAILLPDTVRLFKPSTTPLSRGDFFSATSLRAPSDPLQYSFLTGHPSSLTHCNATMTNTRQTRPKNLGEVEQAVMDYIWSHGPSSSEACREALASSRPMKDSTIRTVLRRLEEKDYLRHEIQGRTFIYRASDARQSVAVRAVKGIIDRFCGGSAEELVLGMVDSAVLSRNQLERLARRIEEQPFGEKAMDETMT